MTSGQCDANISHDFLLKVCMGIVAVAGMPETRINLNFVLFFSLLWVAIIYITFVNCNTIIVQSDY